MTSPDAASDPVYAITDNGYLETCRMRLPSVIRSGADVQKLLNSNKTITLHGRRHSQGGQTLMEGGVSVDLDLLRTIEINNGQTAITVGAGAHWDDVHRKLEPYKLSPITHQSSPGFTIGGSLSVNCHGRNPSQGPVCNTVRSIELMLPNGEIKNFEAGTEGYKNAIGGYGGCGVILSAVINVEKERVHRHEIPEFLNVDAYIERLNYWESNGFPVFHHAWLSCGSAEKGELFKEALVYAAYSEDDKKPENLLKESLPLLEEGILTDDILSVVYGIYRDKTVGERYVAWKSLMKQLIDLEYHRDRDDKLNAVLKRGLNSLRSLIRFTQLPQFGKRVDLLQEYFVPFDQLTKFLDRAKEIIKIAQSSGALDVLSVTVRVLKSENEKNATTLAYAKDGKLWIAVAMNFVINDISDAHPQRTKSTSKVHLCMNKLIGAAIGCGGSFYLPYGRFCDAEQLLAAYPAVQSYMKYRKNLPSVAGLDSAFLKWISKLCGI